MASAAMQQKRAAYSVWTRVSSPPVLADGEIGWDITNNQARMGNGSSLWASLPIIGSGSVSLATSTTMGSVKLFSDTAQSVAANSVTATTARTYGLQLNASGQGVVNVPWTDTVYTLPLSTSAIRGGLEIFSDTVQTVAASAVTATASRTYGIQLNSVDQAVVNVPWTDTTYTFATGTTNGTFNYTPLGGSATAVSIFGLGSNAFNSTAFLSSYGYLANYQTTAAAVTTGAITLGGASVASSPLSISIVGGSVSAAGTGSAAGVTISGGNQTNTALVASGGSVTITGGTGNATNGAGGGVTINGGTGSVANGNGFVSIGTGAGTDSVTIGKSGGSTTIAGTLSAVPTFPSQTARYVLMGPTSGSASPTFRAIVGGDLSQYGDPSVGGSVLQWTTGLGATTWTSSPAILASGGTTAGTMTGSLTLAAATATLSPLTLTTGTQPTLASQAFGQVAAGAESVGLGTTKTTGAGPGFGIIQAPQMVFSLADAPASAITTTGVPVFAAANDVLSSLEAAKLYRFKGKYYVTYTAGGTAASLQLLFAFANAPQAIKYSFRTTKSTSATTFDQVGIGAVATGVSVSVSNQTSGTFVVEFDGYFTSNATTGGTLTPQIAASASTSGGTFMPTTGSWFEVQKIGTATQTLIAGNWG